MPEKASRKPPEKYPVIYGEPGTEEIQLLQRMPITAINSMAGPLSQWKESQHPVQNVISHIKESIDLITKNEVKLNMTTLVKEIEQEFGKIKDQDSYEKFIGSKKAASILTRNQEFYNKQFSN